MTQHLRLRSVGNQRSLVPSLNICDKGNVKPCHTAALALMGWYLMLPPALCTSIFFATGCQTPPEINLTARVQFTAAEFVITNSDDFD
jgi:hypothetical protein